MLHVTEEFLFPGGFIEWYQEWVPSKTRGTRPGYLVWINTLMIGVCVIPVALGATTQGVGVWYSVAAIGAANAAFHLTGVFSLRKYSPGVITGVLLYLPIFVIGSYLLLSAGEISWIRAAVTTGAAIGYHIFSIFRQKQ
jgi:hypothetical protein